MEYGHKLSMEWARVPAQLFSDLNKINPEFLRKSETEKFIKKNVNKKVQAG